MVFKPCWKSGCKGLISVMSIIYSLLLDFISQNLIRHDFGLLTCPVFSHV